MKQSFVHTVLFSYTGKSILLKKCVLMFGGELRVSLTILNRDLMVLDREYDQSVSVSLFVNRKTKKESCRTQLSQIYKLVTVSFYFMYIKRSL